MRSKLIKTVSGITIIGIMLTGCGTEAGPKDATEGAAEIVTEDNEEFSELSLIDGVMFPVRNEDIEILSDVPETFREQFNKSSLNTELPAVYYFSGTYTDENKTEQIYKSANGYADPGITAEKNRFTFIDSDSGFMYILEKGELTNTVESVVDEESAGELINNLKISDGFDFNGEYKVSENVLTASVTSHLNDCTVDGELVVKESTTAQIAYFAGWQNMTDEEYDYLPSAVVATDTTSDIIDWYDENTYTVEDGVGGMITLTLSDITNFDFALNNPATAVNPYATMESTLDMIAVNDVLNTKLELVCIGKQLDDIFNDSTVAGGYDFVDAEETGVITDADGNEWKWGHFVGWDREEQLGEGYAYRARVNGKDYCISFTFDPELSIDFKTMMDSAVASIHITQETE